MDSSKTEAEAVPNGIGNEPATTADRSIPYGKPPGTRVFILYIEEVGYVYHQVELDGTIRNCVSYIPLPPEFLTPESLGKPLPLPPPDWKPAKVFQVPPAKGYEDVPPPRQNFAAPSDTSTDGNRWKMGNLAENLSEISCWSLSRSHDDFGRELSSERNIKSNTAGRATGNKNKFDEMPRKLTGANLEGLGKRRGFTTAPPPPPKIGPLWKTINTINPIKPQSAQATESSPIVTGQKDDTLQKNLKKNGDSNNARRNRNRNRRRNRNRNRNGNFNCNRNRSRTRSRSRSLDHRRRSSSTGKRSPSYPTRARRSPPPSRADKSKSSNSNHRSCTNRSRSRSRSRSTGRNRGSSSRRHRSLSRYRSRTRSRSRTRENGNRSQRRGRH